MRGSRPFAVLGAVVLLLGILGCKGGSGSAADVPAAFTVNTGATQRLAITAEGGGAGVSTGEAYAAVYVPGGAAAAGTEWTITPLAEAPAGVEHPLCPGVYVDTAGAKPTDWCAIGFSIPGTASPDATIVKLAEDGTVAQVVATTRMDYGGRTFLTAYVDGFSAYTTSEEDQEARDQAFVDQAKAKGQEVDWTIKVIGTETQNVQGWTFNYELDIFASGGGIGQGGAYKGTAMLSMDGTYQDTSGSPWVQGFGDVNGIGRDQALTFQLIDPGLASLLTGASEPVAGSGVMNLSGMGDLNISAVGAQGEKGEVNKNDVESSGGVAFTIKVTTFEDVQVEIDKVGIFPGKILRTTK